MEVRGAGRATREACGAIRTTAPSGGEGGRNQGSADWLMGRGTTGFGRGGRRERLVGIIRDPGDLEHGGNSGDARDLELVRTSGDMRLWGITSSNSSKKFSEGKYSLHSATGRCALDRSLRLV